MVVIAPARCSNSVLTTERCLASTRCLQHGMLDKVIGSVMTACITWVPPEPSHHLGAAGTAALSALGTGDSAADSAPAQGNAESAGKLTGHLWVAAGTAALHLL